MTQISLPEFFGAPLEEVNSLFVSMIEFDHTNVAPHWCRGKSSISQAPRWVALDKIEKGQGWYRADLDFLGQPEIAMRMRWIVETLSGPWSLRFCETLGEIPDEDQGFIFQKKSDAVQFALRWRGNISPV